MSEAQASDHGNINDHDEDLGSEISRPWQPGSTSQSRWSDPNQSDVASSVSEQVIPLPEASSSKEAQASDEQDDVPMEVDLEDKEKEGDTLFDHVMAVLAVAGGEESVSPPKKKLFQPLDPKLVDELVDLTSDPEKLRSRLGELGTSRERSRTPSRGNSRERG